MVRWAEKPSLRAASCCSVDVMNDDLVYARDLGLIAPGDPVRIANPIYQEILPRVLSAAVQMNIDEQKAAWYLRPDGTLDLVLLLSLGAAPAVG